MKVIVKYLKEVDEEEVQEGWEGTRLVWKGSVSVCNTRRVKSVYKNRKTKGFLSNL